MVRKIRGIYILGWVLLFAPAASAATPARPDVDAAARLEWQGQSLFSACEFKKAARAFEAAAATEPDQAAVHYWLGKSYARLAEVSSFLYAPKNARKAQHNLELAVQLDPANKQYLEELLEFYMGSPEYLIRARARVEALMERISAIDPDAVPRLRMLLANARDEYSGADWQMERAILGGAAVLGSVVPQR